MFFQVLLKVGRDVVDEIETCLLKGILAFDCAGNAKVLQIHPIRGSLSRYGLKVILNFRRNRDDWSLPQNFYDLIPALTTADNLGDEVFIRHIANELCVHPLKLTMASDIKKVVRDRYRLMKRVVKLTIAACDRCVLCKDVIVDLDSVNTTNCCGARIHVMCMKIVSTCPGCGDGWIPLPCCRCKHDMSYSEHAVERMACCDADIHKHCLFVLRSRQCPSCGVYLKKDGYPYIPVSVAEYVKSRRAMRRVQRARNGAVV